MAMRKMILRMLLLLMPLFLIPKAVHADGGFASGLPVPWYWLVFAGAMISSAGILIYRKNTKVYKD